MAKAEQDPLLAELKAYLREWKPRLYLDSWDIQIEIDNEIDCYAQVETFVQGNNVTIKFRDPDTIPDEWNWEQNWFGNEQVFVHELLHIGNVRWEGMVKSAKKKTRLFDEYERSLDLIARALIAAKTGKIRLRGGIQN